jgi:hypothetical protein
MHFDTMLVPELLNELAIPDDVVDLHALCLKELLVLYPSSKFFAKSQTLAIRPPDLSGALTWQAASLEYHAGGHCTPVLSIVTHTTSTACRTI